MSSTIAKEKTNGNGKKSGQQKEKTNGNGQHSSNVGGAQKEKTNGNGRHSSDSGGAQKEKTNGDGGKHMLSALYEDEEDDTAETPLVRRTVWRDSDSSGEEHGTIRTHRGTTGTTLVHRDKSPRRRAFLIQESEANSEESLPKLKKGIVVHLAGVALVILTVILLVIVIYLATMTHGPQYCDFSDSDYVRPRDLNNPEIFDDLSPAEYNAVYEFILANKTMGVSTWDKATIDSSYILVVELKFPDKKSATQYLDNNSRKPTREAKVVIVRGDHSPPSVEEYIVSPLPRPRSLTRYKNPSFRRDSIPYSSRPIDLIDYRYLYGGILNRTTEQMYPLLMESFGRCYHNCTQGVNCLEIFDVAPRGLKSGDRKSWFWMFASVDGFYIHPLGSELLINHVSTDISDWTVDKVVFNGQKFDSVAELMAAYQSKTLQIRHVPNDKLTNEYSYYDAKEPLAFKPVQGPKFVEPEGKRFTVDGQRVTYRDWHFYYSMTASSGMKIFDIKFEGTRLAYEISLQEVLVLYSGYGPTQSNTMYYDVSFLPGSQTMGLVRGVDCPDTAVYLDTHFLANSGRTQLFKENVCVFEQNAGMPIRRHYGNNFYGSYSFYGGLTDYRLVIRTIANVMNYDYIFDYIFHSNGAVEMKLSATGYVQATFLLPEERRFGSPIQPYVMADLHHHVFNYKIDLDIAGENNRYSVLEVGTETIDDPWIDGVKRTHEHITRKEIKKESKDIPFNSNVPQYHLIYNNGAKNKFGTNRSYRINNKAATHYLLANASVTASAQWAKYPVIVTQRKESEQSPTSIYAQNDPWTPMVDFDDFVDGDSLEDTDLVAWVTMGVHHIPGTEDVPSTPTTWNHYSTFLQPHNYFDVSPNTKSPDNVVIRPPRQKDGRPSVKTHGRSFQTTCIQKTVGPFDYEGDLIDL